MNRLGAMLALLAASPVLAADWPQWRGPKRDANTPEIIEPWTGEPKTLWSAKVGFGYSTPVVAGGKVFVHARVDGQEREEMIAFHAKTGQELWRTAYDREQYSSDLNTGPQATPAVVGGKVYGFGVTGVLTCFDAETGAIVWQVDTAKTLKARRPQFGCCCSPVVIGNKVIVAVGGTGRSVVAFDTKTGAVAWRALDEAANTSSPVIYAAAGKPVPDVVFMSTLRVVGLNPLDGQVNWDYPLPFQPSGTAPTPVLTGDLAITSTMDNGTTGIRLAPGDPDKVWQAKTLAGYFSSGVAAKDRVFLVTNVLKPIPRADLACVETSTGKELWKKNGIGYFHFGMVRTANDKLVILDDSGRLKLLDAAAPDYRELCSAKVCGGNLVTPAVADGCLFARDAEQVVCVKLVP